MKKKELSRKLSIVVCSKNEEKIIEKCLRSIVSNKPDEIIVVDASDTDSPPPQFEALANHILQSPLGRARQMNKGAQIAKGEVLLFLQQYLI